MTRIAHFRLVRSFQANVLRIIYLIGIPLCVAGCSPQVPSGASKPTVNAVAQVSSQPSVEPTKLTGAELYLQHCAGCHGEQGNGQGLASFVLFPKPRDFRAGNFRLISTDNQIPRPEDIEAVIARGMPGSSMPPWPNFSKSERQLLVGEVLKFHRAGLRDRFVAQIKEDEGDDAEIDEEVVENYLEVRAVPGEAVKSPKFPASDAAAIARGGAIYTRQACGSCHGATGKGDGQTNMVDSEGLPTRPRDLTRGIFKGMDDPTAIYLRLRIGMPGTPMPASANLTDDEIVDLTHYLLSLSTPENRAAAVLNRERIVARHVLQLPEEPDDSAWTDVASSVIRLTPLWWRDNGIESVAVRALYDDKTFALRLEWDDATADHFASRTQAFRDGAAVELITGKQEPFLGMGGPGAPVDAWMWDADHGTRGGQLEDTYPRVVVDSYPLTEQVVETAEYQRPGTKTNAQNPISLTAQAVGNQNARSGPHASGGTALTAAGPGTVTFRLKRSQLVTAIGQWKDGRWTVIFMRPLVVNDNEGVTLTPGQPTSIALAVWDGAQRDRNGQKQVSIWQDLELETSR